MTIHKRLIQLGNNDYGPSLECHEKASETLSSLLRRSNALPQHTHQFFAH
jgi:hypothetical protein